MRHFLICALLVAALIAIVVVCTPTKESFQSTLAPFKEECQVKEVWSKIPSRTRKRIITNYTQQIPFTIVQTNEDAVLPGMKKAISTWIDLNPEYEHLYFTGKECREWLAKEYSQRTIDAYDSLVPGAYKADLFRICFIYKHGGVYVDSAMENLVPLREIIQPHHEFVSAKDDGVDAGIYQAFFAATPQHPALAQIIELILERVEKQEYGHRDLYITGPVAFGHGLNKWLGREQETDFDPGNYAGGRVFLYHRYSKENSPIGGIFDTEGGELIHIKYPCSFAEKAFWNPVSYSTLWKERKVFKNAKVVSPPW